MAHFMKAPTDSGFVFLNVDLIRAILPVSQGNHSQCIIVFDDGNRFVANVGHAVFAERANAREASA